MAYLRKGHRDDHVLMFDPSHPDKNQQLLQTYLRINQEELFKVFSVMIILEGIMREFIKSKDLKQVSSCFTENLRSSYFFHGIIFYFLLDYSNAIKQLEKAKEYFLQNYDRNHIFFEQTLINLGMSYFEFGNYKKAIEIYEEAIKSVKRFQNYDLKAKIQLLNNLANCYQRLGELNIAIKNYEEVLNNLNVYGENIEYRERDDAAAGIYQGLGACHYELMRFHQAEINYNKAKEVYTKLHGRDSILISDILNNLGLIYYRQLKYIKAIEAFEESKKIREKIHGENHTAVAQVLNNLGLVYKCQMDYAKAVKFHKEAEQIYNEHGLNFHPGIAYALQNLGMVLIEQRQFQEGRRLLEQAMDIFLHFNHHYFVIAQKNHAFSYLREGNMYLLQEQMNIEQASCCYQLFNQQNVDMHILQQPADPRDPQSHQQLASLFYESNQLLPTIEHYQILLRLPPNDASAHHNLACMLHVLAQIEKDKGDYVQYKVYLDAAQLHFETAIGLENKIEAYVNYAQFMWKNREYFQVENIIIILQKAIKLEQLDHRLDYGMMEQLTVVRPLQELIDEENPVSFNAIQLAYFLLIQIYCETNQLKQASQNMRLLKDEIINQSEQLSNKVKTSLQQGAPEHVDARFEEFAILFQVNKKQQQKIDRLVNKLVKLSQLAIEAKQQEIAKLSVQANTRVEQQIEITEMVDTQSQMSSQPLPGRSASPAQLILQFSSIIRLPTDENPNVSQQAQASEHIADEDRVERVTEDADAEHESSRKLTQ